MLVLHDRMTANLLYRSTCIVCMLIASHVTKKSFRSAGTASRLRPNDIAARYQNLHAAMRMRLAL